MALRSMTAGELAGAPTLFTTFMGRSDSRYKTVGELLAIFRERYAELPAAHDRADDLRVNRFMADMAADRWSSDLVMRLGVFDGVTFVIDGIHRGMAYLACRQAGIGVERLPALCVEV